MYEEVLEEGRGPRVPRSQGPRYLKVIFKYELDSKEGPSCLIYLPTDMLIMPNL